MSLPEDILSEYFDELESRGRRFVCKTQYCRGLRSVYSGCTVDNTSSFVKYDFGCNECGSTTSFEVGFGEVYKCYETLMNKGSTGGDFSSVKWFVLLLYSFRKNEVGNRGSCIELLEKIVTEKYKTLTLWGRVKRVIVTKLKKWVGGYL